MNLKIISAGAGSGKTYRLTQEMVQLLKSGVRASGIIATTFTTKAAAELQERVRIKLLEEGLSDEANDLTNALIGTVHSLGVKLLKKFAFEAGISPEVAIIADEDQQVMFNKSLATVLTNERINRMENFSDRLGLNKRERYDWRLEVKKLCDVARVNDFSIEVLEKSKSKSFESFKTFLGPVSKQSEDYFSKKLKELISETIFRLKNNEDETKITSAAIDTLKGFSNILNLKNELNWHEWVKILKLKVGAKSRGDAEQLIAFAKDHDKHPAFQQDIQNFTFSIFDIAIEAIKEYDDYKKQRGLIDYIDMEIQVKRLLDDPKVKSILSSELDLLMVDEFQDTSPIQLEIFLKLSKIAKHSVWVGDPKQSIYGFRGADPKLMLEIINASGGVKPEDIQEFSWRSREDIVNMSNALFSKAFSDIPNEQIVLNPKRTKLDNPNDPNFIAEPLEMNDAIIQWHFHYDGEGRMPARPWMENCIAHTLTRMLERETYILPKEENTKRRLQAGDIAILCRSNAECLQIAEALHRAGLKAAISRNGLLSTAESKLILACLKFILNPSDSLSVAEILLLAARMNIETIIESRLDFLEKLSNNINTSAWASENPIIEQLNNLRSQVVELSSAEILDLVLEELDLRRTISSWGKVQQRMDNIDELRKLALKYEEACNRLHTAASLGGMLLWLNELEKGKQDMQGSGEGTDAVNVMTYHKSKGLEWPVVICHSLEGGLRDNVWGINIESEPQTIDLDSILGNRWLRYWINPYADQQHNTPLIERINESEIKKRATQQALQEDARLLYVGITRARDYLIFPTRNKPTKWLNRIWHDGDESIPTLDHTSFESPWEWNGMDIIKDTPGDLIFPRDFPYSEPLEENIAYFNERAGKNYFPPLRIDINHETFDTEYLANTANAIRYDQGILIDDEVNQYIIAKMLKAFLIADNLNYSTDARLEMAEAFAERYGVTEGIDYQELTRISTSFYSFLKNNFSIKRMYRKYLVRVYFKDRLFEKIIDFVLETDDGLVIIQNSGFSGEEKSWTKKSKELFDFLFLAEVAILKTFEQQNIKSYVHFVLGAGIQQVLIKLKVSV